MSNKLTDASKDSQKAGNARPEAVQYMLVVWLFAVIVEFFHQLLSIALALLNSEQLFAAARQTASNRETELSDAMVNLVAYGSLGLTSVLSFVIIGILAYLLSLLAKNHKHAGLARRMWFAFSLYFAFRLMFVFMSSPAGSDAPDWLYMVDGILQILIGVAAIMGFAFSVKDEVLDYTGELEQMRELEKEAKLKREEARRAKEEREKEKAAKDKADKDKREKPQTPHLEDMERKKEDSHR